MCVGLLMCFSFCCETAEMAASMAMAQNRKAARSKSSHSCEAPQEFYCFVSQKQQVTKQSKFRGAAFYFSDATVLVSPLIEATVRFLLKERHYSRKPTKSRGCVGGSA